MVRLLTGLLVAGAAWALTFLAPRPVFIATIAALMLLALHEFYTLTAKCGWRTMRIAGFAGGLLWLLLPHLDRGHLATLMAVLLLAAALLSRRTVQEIPLTAAMTLLGVVYIAGPMLSGLLVHDRSAHWFALVLVAAGVGDAAALAVGRTLGRRPLAATVSPNKTWEGACGSLIAGSAATIWYASTFLEGELQPLAAACLAVVLNAACQIGDLAESALKRSAGVKDSGRLLPRHGGILDRIDALLFAMPVLYGYLLLQG